LSKKATSLAGPPAVPGERIEKAKLNCESRYTKSGLPPGVRKKSCRDCKFSALCLTRSTESVANMFRRCSDCGKMQWDFGGSWGHKDQWFTEKDVCARFTDFMDHWGLYSRCPQCRTAQSAR
jgi:hypothetical protein